MDLKNYKHVHCVGIGGGEKGLDLVVDLALSAAARIQTAGKRQRCYRSHQQH